MTKKRATEGRKIPNQRLYIGEWMSFAGVKAVQIVKETGMNPGYVSQLVNWGKRNADTGKKEHPNPSLAVLEQVAEVIGIQTVALFSPPPTVGTPIRISKSAMGALDDIAAAAKEKNSKPRKK